MTTTLPVHDEIARRSHEIWEAKGRPEGCDVEHWLEAEHQLTAAHPHAHGAHAIAPNPAELTAKADAQKEAARAPQVPHVKDAPKPTPPESGKPVWRKPHSS